MVELTDKARQELDAYFADKEKSPIRIFLAPGGCSGPRLSLALDEAQDTDETYTYDGYTFVVEKGLAGEGQPFTVDMSYMGFVVDSKLELGGGGSCSTGGCSGCG